MPMQAPDLPPGSVHLWTCDLSENGSPVEQCHEAITAGEKEHATRFRFEVHRHRHIRGRAFLRTVLGRYCATAPKDLGLKTRDNGKPYIEGAPVTFNLSHSADVAVLGVAKMSEIGVDVECFDRKVECINIARRYFAKSECHVLEQQNDEGQRDLFFRLWTSKEAAMKATGEGLRIDPRTVEVELGSSLRPAAYCGRFQPWHLNNEDLESKGATVSVAAPEPFSISWIDQR